MSVTQRRPPTRPLRVYAFDPIVGKQLDNAVLETSTLNVKWEELQPGPSGEYLDVVDYDPSSACFYEPVDLNEPFILAQAGLQPSEGDPQFHQQMVYAVAMTTIASFERALGRRALWAPKPYQRNLKARDRYVGQLRIYPHALREPNAYYSPEKKALLFGYFPALRERAGANMPGGLVFTCLSHDVIAHETTHALVDGLHPYFIEPSNPDVLAFHEAFSDIVALFQHFSQPEPVRHQIAESHGKLSIATVLGSLAHQFGQATGKYGSLRQYVGEDSRTDVKFGQEGGKDLSGFSEPHDRGAQLVAAVFDAYLMLYQSRVADLMRIASNGTGMLQPGALHPDLVARMADEASKLARHISTMCIRALDYCPPFDITFGDFLRALITADRDLVPEDPRRYRVAIIESFRRRGIYPSGVRTLSAESLSLQNVLDEEQSKAIGGWLRQLEAWEDDDEDRDEEFERADVAWNLREDRLKIFLASENDARRIHRFIFSQDFDPELARSLGLATTAAALPTYMRCYGAEDSQRKGSPKTKIHAVRPARRIGPDGQAEADLVLSIIQTRDVPLYEDDPHGDTFRFRGGCTLLIDRERHRVRWCVVKSIFDEQRLQREREYRTDASGFSMAATYFGDPRQKGFQEPFAFLHRGV